MILGLPLLPTPKSHSSTVVGFVTKSGISNSALNLSVVTRGGDWIIYSSATDHMTCDPHKFINFYPNCSKTAIVNANGVSSPIESVGTISLSPSLSIPCVALFYPTHSLFHIHSKEKIGSGRERRTILS